MVLNEIIEQAAGRQSRVSDQGGKYNFSIYILPYNWTYTIHNFTKDMISSRWLRL